MPSDQPLKTQFAPWPAAREQRLRELWPTGMSDAEMAAELGVTRRALTNKAQRMKLEPYRAVVIAPKLTPEQDEAIRRLLAAGMPMAHIAKQVGVGRGRVEYIKRHLSEPADVAPVEIPPPPVPAPQATPEAPQEVLQARVAVNLDDLTHDAWAVVGRLTAGAWACSVPMRDLQAAVDNGRVQWREKMVGDDRMLCVKLAGDAARVLR